MPRNCGPSGPIFALACSFRRHEIISGNDCWSSASATNGETVLHGEEFGDWSEDEYREEGQRAHDQDCREPEHAEHDGVGPQRTWSSPAWSAVRSIFLPRNSGALLSAIGIAAIDRTMRFNVLAMSGKAVEAAGDVQTLILDKTGTITTGNREANDFIAVHGFQQRDLIQAAFLASYFDTTPEGRSVVSCSAARGAQPVSGLDQAKGLDFSAQTRMSGIDLVDGRVIRKGAVNAVVRHAVDEFHASVPADLQVIADRVSKLGATPLAISINGDILGIVVLSDTLKPGIRERIAQLRKMAIRTIMVTGDNPMTAQTIAAEAGVDDFVAEVEPEEKLRIVRQEQSAGGWLR